MLDKTKNLFTCSPCGDREAIRFPVRRHVRAWVKKELYNQYQAGYEAGRLNERYIVKARLKKLKPDDNNYDFRSLLIDSELPIHDHGYYCAKDDILGGL